MSKFLQRVLVCLATAVMPLALSAQQLPDPGFEDWSGSAFDGNVQPKYWHGSNVEQSALGMSFKFNFTHQEAGHTGKYCLMVQDQVVGAAGITETGPGYASLGYGWQYLEGLNTGSATAGTKGGYAFTYRPDTVSVWIKRTGSNTDKEDFHILFYSWSGTAQGTSYKNKNTSCTSVTVEDEESDIRVALDGNQCKTTTPGGQVAEGWLRDRKQYNNWTNVRVPIYYMNDNAPKKCNLIFSASNYPNFRANDGLYEGNSLYIDDVELIYSSKIQVLRVGGKEWKGFDPNETEKVQSYPVPEGTTEIPTIEAYRGAGSLTNAAGKTVTFQGRKLSGSEISISSGKIDATPVVITVKSEDGKSTTKYKIMFEAAKSSNTKLATISYTYTGADNEQHTQNITGFSPTNYNYTVELPYGSKGVPTVGYEKQEDEQKVEVTQPTSLTGTAQLKVTAADGTNTKTYMVKFSVGQLADNTLKDILVNGKSIPGFSPTQAVYKVSLPVGTTQMPTVKAVSAYKDGEQTITYTQPSVIDGGQYLISVTTPGNTVPKVYKLNFKLEASSYSYLGGLSVKEGAVEYITNFEPTKTTYYVHLPLGTTSLPKITCTKGDDYQTLAVSELGANVVDGTVRVTVTAANGEQTVYKIVFTTEKSDRSTLKGILIGGDSLPGFDPDVLSYNYNLPIGTTVLPTIEPVVGDEYQTYVVTLAGVNGKTRITVTAGDGSTTVYQIAFSVATYSVNTLKAIFLNGDTLAGFNPEVNEYTVDLPQGTTALPTVTYQLENEQLQSASVRPVTGLSGDYKITVRPQSGASRTYIIHFSVATSSNTKLAMIYLDGKPIPGFHEDTTLYVDSLPEGVSTIPAVTCEKGEATQRVLSVLTGKTQTITVTAESGAKRDYTIMFIVRASENAFLEMIYLDGDSLEGFSKQKLEYEVPLTSDKCPVITVDKAPGQQVTITAPYAAGKATIKVSPESGSPNEYKITFKAAAAQSVQLASIHVDGVAIPGFEPSTLSYNASYQNALPDVQGIGQAGQTVRVLWKDNVAWLHVTDSLGNKAAYSVTFNRILSTDSSLEGIYANGLLVAGFSASKLDYEFELPAGSAYPEVTYKAGSQAQVVFFGQVEEGKWAVTVVAEDGTKTTYTVRYTIKKYDDTTLAGIELEGRSFLFKANKNEYYLSLDEGAELPKMTVTAREGQRVVQYNENDSTQKVFVMAENGDTETYTLNYNRVQSTNALLNDILIDGESLAGFDPNVTHYIDTIPLRSKCVPNVYPIGAVATQTITTHYSRPNGQTWIHVEAQSGASKNYYITFPTRKSTNTRLGDLYLDSDEADIKFKPNQTEYTVELPYSATACPKVVYEKDEDEQRIDFISRPIGDTTQVIVYAENGDARTYNIFFKRGLLKKNNLLTALRIKELDQSISLKDKTKRNFDVNMPYGSRSLTVEYEKSYEAQTVFVEPGGVYNPTIITVKANNDTIADEIYTINPVIATADPAVVTDLKVNNVTIPGFDPEKFSYIVPVTEKPKLRYTLNKGAEINIISQTSKHWEAEVTYGEGADARTNIYNVWYYYTNEQVPSSEFNSSEWTACETYTDNGAQKPIGWHTISDALGKHGVFTPEDLVQKETSPDAVHLHSAYSASGGGTIPGFITLGKITGGSWGSAGSSSFPITGGIAFHNSPDVMQINYKQTKLVSGKTNQIQYILTGTDDTAEKEWKESSTSSSYTVHSYDLSEINAKAGEPISLNIILNSFTTTNSQTDPHVLYGNPQSADMYVDWIRFTYNHTLTGLKADNFTADLSGNEFTVTLTDPERIEKPVLLFTGEVTDQAQDVVWNAPTKSGSYETRTATIRNWAENGTDYSDYTLTVKRPLDTKNELANLLIDTVPITGFSAAVYNYTVQLPVTRRNVPDIMPIPGSSLQTVTTAYNKEDSTMTITVTPEKGEAKVYTVKFTSELSNDTKLTNITVDGVPGFAFDANTTNYNIKASQWPVISFEKKSDLQVVTLNNGVITVKAEDGTIGTYTITRSDTIPAANGVIKEFENGDNIISGFGNDDLTYDAAKPMGAVLFTRMLESDSVVFVQKDTEMSWTIPGTGKTYTWTYVGAAAANANLADITINGQSLAEFLPSELNYELITDSMIVVAPVAAESSQTLQLTYHIVDGDLVDSISVTSKNATNKTYSVRVRRPISDDATLSGIMLDSVLIDGFHPDSMNYTQTLAVGAIKTAQPKMPSITYVAGQNGQSITVEPGQLNGDPTIITVQSEDSTRTSYYSVTLQSEKSHCSDLTGITVNGVAIDYFEPGRHFYSVSLKTDDINVDYTTDDRFQKVETLIDVIKAGHEYHYTLHVMAEDSTTSDYLVEIYIENQSNDAQLANITLDGQNFEDFRRDLNTDLTFDGGQNNYVINLPSDATILPEVSAQLKMNGQQVEILHSEDTIKLDVTAVDGTTHNTYILYFNKPKSTNANLSMIFLNGDSLKGFEPTYYFYQVNLPEGVHVMPEVVGQKGEASQTLDEVEMDVNKMQATLRVHAEDPAARENAYVVIFHITQSNADTLANIYEDGQPLEGFAPRTMYYTRSLPVGTAAFPDISWEEVNDLQTIKMDTVEYTANTLIRQIQVTAESGKKNIYTVSYTIEKSNVDTLQMIFIDQKQLAGFKATQTEYTYTLSAADAIALNGVLPVVEYIQGDEYQEVFVSQALDSLSHKSLGYKSLITVKAATGQMNIYTIHFEVESSTDATLNMINVSGKPLANYDAERYNYKLEIEKDAAVPVVSVIKKEEAQVYEIRVLDDTVKIVVWAESVKDSATYTLTFERLKSNVTILRDIILKDAEGETFPTSEFPYRQDVYAYIVKLPYNNKLAPIDQLPSIETVLYDAEQQTDTTRHFLPSGDIQVDITVTAANGEDQAIYSILFQFVKPSDALLAMLSLHGEEFADFRPTKSEYVYAHPYGTDPKDYFTEKDVTYVLSDSLAKVDTIYMDEFGVINITVLAQDGRSSMTYLISQITAKDGDNALAWLTVNGDTIPGFDPDVTFYTYYVFSSDVPSVDAAPRSENALNVDIGRVEAGDTCVITCTAADGTDRLYYIYFAITEINPGVEASSNDVIIKRVPGAAQLFVGTIRAGVDFALYDWNGHQVYYRTAIPTAAPNNVDVYTDSDAKEVLNEIKDYSDGLTIDIQLGQPYFYVFFTAGKKVASGQIIAL